MLPILFVLNGIEYLYPKGVCGGVGGKHSGFKTTLNWKKKGNLYPQLHTKVIYAETKFQRLENWRESRALRQFLMCLCCTLRKGAHFLFLTINEIWFHVNRDINNPQRTQQCKNKDISLCFEKCKISSKRSDFPFALSQKKPGFFLLVHQGTWH